MRRQLDEIHRPQLFEATLEETGRVREEFGWPIMVTPFSQFVGTQAVLNVMGGERYASIPDDVIVYFLGHFGTPAAPPDPDVADRVLSHPRAAQLRGMEPLTLDGARGRYGSAISDEELLLRLTMPAEQVDAMRAAERAARPPRPARSPVVKLLQEVAKRPAVAYLSVDAGEDHVEYRRAHAT
jgi:oxaloacetate decarboxylase alpha subunit